MGNTNCTERSTGSSESKSKSRDTVSSCSLSAIRRIFKIIRYEYEYEDEEEDAYRSALDLLKKVNDHHLETVTDRDGYTLLMSSIHYKIDTLTSCLLHTRIDACNIMHISPSGADAATVAIRRGDTYSMDRLLRYEKYIPPKRLGIYVTSTEKTYDTLLHYALDRTYSIKSSSWDFTDRKECTRDMIMVLLNHPEKCGLDHIHECGDTPLIYALERCEKRIVKKMLKYPHLCNLHVSANSGTAICYAIRNGYDNIVNTIVDYAISKRDISTVFKGDKMDLLIKLGEKKIFNGSIRRLILSDMYSHSDVSKSNHTTLMFALMVLNDKELMDRYSDRLNECNVDHMNTTYNNALAVACRYVRPKMVLRLLEESSTDTINSVLTSTDTVLTHAICHLSDDMAVRFIPHCTDETLNKINCKGCNALILACSRGKTQTVEALLDRGCHTGVVDNAGYTALIGACKNKMYGVINRLIRYPIRCKLDHKMKNESALTILIKNDDYELVNRLSRVLIQLQTLRKLKAIDDEMNIEDVTIEEMEDVKDITVNYRSKGSTVINLSPGHTLTSPPGD